MRVRLSSHRDVGDDLTELLSALTEFNRGTRHAAYAALQQLAEGTDGSLDVDGAALAEFTAYMGEFGIGVRSGKSPES